MDDFRQINDTRRLAAISGLKRKLVVEWRQKYLRWHRPGQLVRHMRELMLLKQTRRELQERVCTPGRGPTGRNLVQGRPDRDGRAGAVQGKPEKDGQVGVEDEKSSLM